MVRGIQRLLLLVFSDPDEEIHYRENTLVASKTLRPRHFVLGAWAVFSIGLGCFVAMWVAAAWRGPNLTHALWTPWSIGVLTFILMYRGADSKNYIHQTSYIAAGCAYLVSFAQALLHGMEPLADFEHAVWCVAGLLQLLCPFLLAYPPRSKMLVYLVNFVGYSALALGGYFGDQLRAICIGGFLLGASLTLGNALERAKRLTFLHVLRESAMVEVHVAKEPSEVRWHPEQKLAIQSPDKHAPCKRRLQRLPPTALTAVITVAHALPLMLLALLIVEVSWLVPACGVSSLHWVGPHAAPSATRVGLLRPVLHLG